MSCRVLHSATIERQRRARARLRAWRPAIRELCPAGHLGAER